MAHQVALGMNWLHRSSPAIIHRFAAKKLLVFISYFFNNKFIHYLIFAEISKQPIFWLVNRTRILCNETMN